MFSRRRLFIRLRSAKANGNVIELGRYWAQINPLLKKLELKHGEGVKPQLAQSCKLEGCPVGVRIGSLGA